MKISNREAELIAEIDSLAYGGGSVGRIVVGPPEMHGKKIILDGAIPGERVSVEIDEELPKFIHGRLVSVLSPSDNRVTPPCPYFNSCGGCQLQHITIKGQREFKLAMIVATLKAKAGCESAHAPQILAPDLPGYDYRRKASLHLNRDGELGFYRRASGEVVDIENCLILSPALKSALEHIREIKNYICDKIGKITLDETPSGIRALFEQREGLDQQLKLPGGISSKLEDCGIKADINSGKQRKFKDPADGDLLASAISFSQVNSAANKVLIDCVLSLVDGGEVTEFYAGSGNFTIPLAESGKSVEAIEIDSDLVAEGKSKAAALGIADRIRFRLSSVEKFVRNNSFSRCVLIDPPRSGAKLICDNVNPDRTKDLVYVSCNLPSFCRDAQQLIKQGYRLKQLFLVDMFPQTHHVEMVGLFSSAA